MIIIRKRNFAGVFPINIVEAKVFPLFETEEGDSLDSYHNLSVSPAFSSILEKKNSFFNSISYFKFYSI